MFIAGVFDLALVKGRLSVEDLLDDEDDGEGDDDEVEDEDKDKDEEPADAEQLGKDFVVLLCPPLTLLFAVPLDDAFDSILLKSFFNIFIFVVVIFVQTI